MGEKTEYDASWINEIPRHILEEILREAFSNLSPKERKELDDFVEKLEKKHGKSLADIALEVSCSSEELSQEEREELYEVWKKYIQVKNIDFRFN